MQKLHLPFLLISSLSIAQVGIGTSSPISKLDVNGEVVLRGSLRVGGTDTTKGKAGEKDQVLVSQGVGNSPTWKYVNVPFMENGQYKLINTYVADNSTGIRTLTAADGVALSNIGDAYTTTWAKIAGLKTSMEIQSTENKITYQLQAGIEANTPTGTAVGEVKFLCGIFKNDKLVALRPDKITTIDEATPIQYIYTLNYTEENVTKGTHIIEVACRRIEGAGHTFAIGTNTVGSTNSNGFALKSFLKIDLAELVTFKTEKK